MFQALCDVGTRRGLPRAVAQRLAIQTGLGSAMLAIGSRVDLDRMIIQVASKKGTTEAALKVLRRRGFSKILQAGVEAARQRSATLSRLLDHAQATGR